MSVRDFIEWLEQYPAWFKIAVSLWLLVGTLLLVGFVFIKRTPVTGPGPVIGSPEQTRFQRPIPELQPAYPNADAEITPGTAPTATDYFATLQSLQDRFHERQEFVDKHRDAIVEWQGTLDSVSEDSRGTPSIHLTLSVHGVGLGKTFSVQLPIGMKTKAFALRQGDSIVVRGRLYVGSAPTYPYIYSQKLERLGEAAR